MSVSSNHVDVEETAIQGLILLDRTRKEAIAELRKNEESRYDQMSRDLYDEPGGQ